MDDTGAHRAPGSLAHDLANTLGGVLLDLQLSIEELADDDPLRPPMRRWAEQVHRAARQVAELQAALPTAEG